MVGRKSLKKIILDFIADNKKLQSEIRNLPLRIRIKATGKIIFKSMLIGLLVAIIPCIICGVVIILHIGFGYNLPVFAIICVLLILAMICCIIAYLRFFPPGKMLEMIEDIKKTDRAI